MPNISPFVLKLETYLRMADIPYQISTKKPFGPSGKTPWISLNGIDVTDSQLIIEYLNKKFAKNLWPVDATSADKAMANSARIMLEEHFFWGMAHWRFIKGLNTLDRIMVAPGLQMKVIKFFFPGRVKKALYSQGLGRHGYDKMFHLVSTDLRIVSDLLGSKQFILGDEPCEVDCALFGALAQVFWGMPDSPYEKLANEQLVNLKDYCIRMREKFWQDWDECLYRERK